MKGGAEIDNSARYRYSLWRIWNREWPGVLFVMLNPSTANALEDDPTIRRCIGFAINWGFGSLEVVNLFAWRSSNPRSLIQVADPVGPKNDEYIDMACDRNRQRVAAWGAASRLLGRAETVLEMIRRYGDVWCLGKTCSGQPRHPLFVKYDKPLELLK